MQRSIKGIRVLCRVLTIKRPDETN